jgi:hypothetical protein
VIDIQIAKSIVDLFKAVIDIADGRTKAKRDSFNRTFKPLYERMEAIAKEYYAALSKTALQLSQPNPDYSSILDELEAKRATIIIARNGILGEALAFKKGYEPEQSRKVVNEDRLAQLAYIFATSIHDYFYLGERDLERDQSAMTGLVYNLQVLSGRFRYADRYRKSVTLDTAREYAAIAVATRERCWTDVAKAYTDLKLFCQS